VIICITVYEKVTNEKKMVIQHPVPCVTQSFPFRSLMFVNEICQRNFTIFQNFRMEFQNNFTIAQFHCSSSASRIILCNNERALKIVKNLEKALKECLLVVNKEIKNKHCHSEGTMKIYATNYT